MKTSSDYYSMESHLLALKDRIDILAESEEPGPQ
jgi:hypothetical protein